MEHYLDTSYHLLLPYSINESDETIINYAKDVLRLFNIYGHVELIKCDSEKALVLEQDLRHFWWINKADEWRFSMHERGLAIYDKIADSEEAQILLHDAWQKADFFSKSLQWRTHFHELLQTEADLSRAYLQVFFRISQQTLSRALRWDAIFPQSQSSPYALLFKLLSFRVLPLGFYGNKFYLQKLGDNAYTPDRITNIPPYRSQNKHKNKIFVCYEFKNDKDFNFLKEQLVVWGFDLQYGPVDENHAPVEHQLGEKIVTSSMLIAMVKEADAEFGLPIWITQEIDLALKYNVPVTLFTTSKNHFYLSDAINVIVYDPASFSSVLLKLKDTVFRRPQ